MNDVGNSVHSMNTIAVSLELLPDTNVNVPPGLNISWKPNSIKQSKIRSRNYSERANIVYVVESLFVYLIKISKNPLWNYPNINFKGKERKAIRTFNFLSQIPGISEDMAILTELFCHWRNRVVHSGTSKATLSSTKRQKLLANQQLIYNNFHHFDVGIALKNFDTGKITLKDVSTMSTIVIKCCREIDNYFFLGAKNKLDISSLKNNLINDSTFIKFYNQSFSKQRERKIAHFVNIVYPYIDDNLRQQIVNDFIMKQ